MDGWKRAFVDWYNLEKIVTTTLGNPMCRQSMHPQEPIMEHLSHTQGISRRQFIRKSAIGVGIGAGSSGWNRLACIRAAEPDTGSFLFGVVTDVHYADAESRGSRHYRDSISKLLLQLDQIHSGLYLQGLEARQAILDEARDELTHAAITV